MIYWIYRMMCLLQDVGLQNNEMDITKILKKKPMYLLKKHTFYLRNFLRVREQEDDDTTLMEVEEHALMIMYITHCNIETRKQFLSA